MIVDTLPSMLSDAVCADRRGLSRTAARLMVGGVTGVFWARAGPAASSPLLSRMVTISRGSTLGRGAACGTCALRAAALAAILGVLLGRHRQQYCRGNEDKGRLDWKEDDEGSQQRSIKQVGHRKVVVSRRGSRSKVYREGYGGRYLGTEEKWDW